MNPPVAPYLLYGALITPVALNYNSMQSYQNSQHQAAVTSAAAGCGEVDNVDLPPNNNRVVTKPNDNDVLLGRGKQTINNIGNRKFRAMIEARKVS